MRTKKEDIEKHKVISFIGQLVDTKFIPFGEGTYAQELEVKSGKEKIKMIFPFVKSHEFKKGEERRWNAIEKETQVVSYSIAQPDPTDKSKTQKVKQFWKEAKETTIILKFDGGHTIDWKRNGFIPYERKATRVKYLEIVMEGLDLSFFTTKITQPQNKKQ